LYVRGRNTYGELGVGNDLPVNKQTKIMERVRTAFFRDGILFAIDQEDTLYAAGTWGGFTTFEKMQRLPDLSEKDKRVRASYQLVPILKDVQSVAFENGTCFCIKKDGSVWSRGFEQFGLTGNGRASEGSQTEFKQLAFIK
jgi:alpha-tubulin suppressor-like RCC1 family protein